MKGFVQKKTTRIVGIITVLLVALVIGIVAAAATSATPTAKAAGSALRVAVFSDDSANPANTAATFRAVQACGFDIYGIGREDIERGRLTTKKYDVLLLPAGASDDRIWYYNTSFGFSDNMKQNVDAFAAAGGGVVGLEGGASFMCADVASPAHSLNLYGGSYTPDYTSGPPGKDTITYQDPSWGTGTQDLYRSYGSGPIQAVTTASGNYGVSTTIATTPDDGNSIMAAEYGTGAVKGHVVVCALLPELRGDSTLDWTIWDNWAPGMSTQVNSIGGWSLLGRMINYAGTGTPTAPTVTEQANPTGRKVAILSSLEFYGTGGVYPAYLQSLYRAVAASGNVPLAVRGRDINGFYSYGSKLTKANFDAFILPEAWYGATGVGETAEAKDIGAAGAQAIKDFANAGGGVIGIGEESAAYLSADYWTEYYGSWTNGTFTHPATLFNGSTVYYDDSYGYQAGVTTSGDPVIGDLNGGNSVQTWTYNWPTFYGLDFVDSLADDGATAVSSYDLSGEVANIRCMYGAGHVFLAGPDNAILSGSNYDWTTWDNYLWGGNTKLTNPDNNKPWDVIKAALNHWVAAPTPTVYAGAPSTWKKAPVTVNLSAADGNGPGIASIEYRLAGDTTWTPGNSITVSADGVSNYEVRAVDLAGNSSAILPVVVKIDTTKPTATDDAPSGWSNSDVTVTITGHDTSSSMGVIQYRLNTSADPVWHNADRSNDVTGYTGTFVVSATANDGVHVYRYRVIDLAGNISDSGICTVRISTL